MGLKAKTGRNQRFLKGHTPWLLVVSISSVSSFPPCCEEQSDPPNPSLGTRVLQRGGEGRQ